MAPGARAAGRNKAEAAEKTKKKKNKEEEECKEPAIGWKKSKAKQLLEIDIIEGRVPREAKCEVWTSTMPLKDIYDSRPEFSEYYYCRFSSRLSALRKTVASKTNRSAMDQEAFENYKQNHPVITGFSRLGFIEWQGSNSQRLFLQDMANGLHKTQSRAELYGSRQEHYNEFTLDVFRDKVKQEIRTAKYLHTMKVKGKDFRKKK